MDIREVVGGLMAWKVFMEWSGIVQFVKKRIKLL